MYNAPHFTTEQMKERLDYDPDSGVFTWLDDGGANGFIGRRAGSIDKSGYRVIRIDRPYYAHRLAWYYIKGWWPSRCIDHINRFKDDNRFINLREANHSQNAANSKPRGESGIKGVSCSVNHPGKFRAEIRMNGRLKFLGDFVTAEEAGAAYLSEARKVYGEFARLTV